MVGTSNLGSWNGQWDYQDLKRNNTDVVKPIMNQPTIYSNKWMESPNGSLFWPFVAFWKERQTLKCFLQWSVINRSLRSWSCFRWLKNSVGEVWWSMVGSCYKWDNDWYDIKSHLQYPLVNIQKAIENCPVEISWVFPWIAWWIFPVRFL